MSFTWLHFADYDGQPDPIPGFEAVLCPTPKYDEATEANAKTYARRASDMSAEGYVIYDLETPDWRLSHDVPDAIARERLSRMVILADMTRECGVQVGFYNQPLRQYWPAIRFGAANASNPTPDAILDAAKSLPWVERNRLIGSYLRGTVDFVSPSIYTFYDAEGTSWLAYAREHIRQARAFWHGVPVVPFIWPGFHPSEPARSRAMPIELWRLQVATMRLFADGAVVYGGRRWKTQSECVRLPWDDEAKEYFAECGAV